MSYKIEIIEGDITQCKVEAIVNAANNKFWMGSGVAGAIKKAGGEIVKLLYSRLFRQRKVMCGQR